MFVHGNSNEAIQMAVVIMSVMGFSVALMVLLTSLNVGDKCVSTDECGDDEGNALAVILFNWKSKVLDVRRLFRRYFSLLFFFAVKIKKKKLIRTVNMDSLEEHSQNKMKGLYII